MNAFGEQVKYCFSCNVLTCLLKKQRNNVPEVEYDLMGGLDLACSVPKYLWLFLFTSVHAHKLNLNFLLINSFIDHNISNLVANAINNQP